MCACFAIMFIAGSYMLYSPPNGPGPVGGVGAHGGPLGPTIPPSYATALTSLGGGSASGHGGAAAFPISAAAAFTGPASVPALAALHHHHRMQQLHHLQQQQHHHHPHLVHHHPPHSALMSCNSPGGGGGGGGGPAGSQHQPEAATDLVLKKMSGFSVSDILERERSRDACGEGLRDAHGRSPLDGCARDPGDRVDNCERGPLEGCGRDGCGRSPLDSCGRESRDPVGPSLLESGAIVKDHHPVVATSVVPKTAACVVITSRASTGPGLTTDLGGVNHRPRSSGYTPPQRPSPSGSSIGSPPPTGLLHHAAGPYPPSCPGTESPLSLGHRCGPDVPDRSELKFGMERILSNELAPHKDLCPPSPPYTCCVSPLTSVRNSRLNGGGCDCPHPFCDGGSTAAALYPFYAYPASAALTQAIAYPTCTFYTGANSLSGSGAGGGGSDLDPRIHAHPGVLGLHHHHHHNHQSSNGQLPPCGGKRKRSWSRAVFSNLQRKGLEKRFQMQKYITKPDRRQLAATLGLTDAQVKVWFQNRRMKWRHSKEAKEEFAKQKNKGPPPSGGQEVKDPPPVTVVHSDAACGLVSDSPEVLDGSGHGKNIDSTIDCPKASVDSAKPPIVATVS